MVPYFSRAFDARDGEIRGDIAPAGIVGQNCDADQRVDPLECVDTMSLTRHGDR